jgi:hypothetical protein
MGMHWQQAGPGAWQDDIYQYLEPQGYRPRHAAPPRLLRMLHLRPAAGFLSPRAPRSAPAAGQVKRAFPRLVPAAGHKP